MSTRTPYIKTSYNGISMWELRGSNPRKVPKRGTVEEFKILPLRNLKQVTEAVTAFAEAQGVSVGDVKFSKQRYDASAFMRIKRPETDEEYDKRVQYVERFNAGLKALKKDEEAVEEWQAGAEQRRQEQQIKIDKSLAEKAKAQLVQDIKVQFKDDAELMGALADEVLSDEKFVKQLKVLFNRSL